MTYEISSIKARETFDGTLNEAIARAIAHEDEYQPAFGVTVTDEAGTDVAEIRDGDVLHAETVITTIRIHLGSDTMLVRCDLTQASAPVQVQYEAGERWSSSQFQCADARHATEGLIDIALQLASIATESRCTRENTDIEVL